MNGHKITIVGCGPGAPEYLTPAARAAIEHADVWVGAPRLLDAFPAMKAERIVLKANIEEVLTRIAARAGRSKVAVLVTGDPGVFSFAKPVLERFGRDACEVIPGISSVQVAFARVGLGGLDARIISAHDKTPGLSFTGLSAEKKIAVLTGNHAAQPWIASLADSLATSHHCFVCENLTLPDERVRQISPSEMKSIQLPGLSIVLLIHKEVRS